MKPPVASGAPDVECEMHHTILVVSDVRKAVEFYTTRLGFSLAFMEEDSPVFAGVNLGHVQIFLQQGTPNPQGCSVYFVVADADALHDYHKSNGVEIVEPLADRPYELRDYAASDLHGYRLSFGHRLYNAGPPLTVERVDVPLRLEKRLAAL